MRIDIHEYAVRIASVAALRSEDPVRQVGAVALTDDNRIIATAYNGAPSGITFPYNRWHDEKWRLNNVIHAEQNLCGLFKRGEATWVALTISPCISCLKLLSAHDIRKVVFRKWYDRESCLDVAKIHKIKLILTP